MADPSSEARILPIETAETSGTRTRYLVLGFTLVLTAVSYLDRVCISMAAPFMQKDLGLDQAQLGLVFSAFTFAYAVMEIPAGWLVDRFGPRRMLARVVLWWSAMTAITGWAGGFLSLLAVRFLFGLGEAGTFPGISRAFVRWLPERAHGNAFGLAVMTGLLGGAVTQKLTAELLSVLSWRHVFPIYALVGVGWATAWYWWFRDNPHDHPSVNAAELREIGTPPPAPHPPVPWGSLAGSGNLWAVCGMYFGCIYGWYFFLTWMPDYLLQGRGFNLRQAGWLAMLPMLCMAMGVAVGGWWSDLLVKRHGARIGRCVPGLIGLPLAAAAVVAAALTTSPLAAALWLAAAGGLAAMGVPPGWAVCLEISGSHAGVVTGTMNTFGNLGGTLMPLVMGQCLNRWGSWNLSLMSVAVCYLFAATCWLVIDPRKPIPDV